MSLTNNSRRMDSGPLAYELVRDVTMYRAGVEHAKMALRMGRYAEALWVLELITNPTAPAPRRPVALIPKQGLEER